MSVVGIGTDIIEISRIENMAINVRDRLALRVLTPVEYEKYQSLKNPVFYLAKRWAGKEAASKALGTGIANGVSFQNFEIKSLASGQPQLHLYDRAEVLATELGAKNWHISLSDEALFATAFVVLST
ncbi:MAG: holo-[acyl-carrier protein] synthase [Colwellia sp.]|jgi:holo-[acyl-carrier protein] synthase